MTNSPRRIATTRKVSLAPYGDALVDSYVIVTLASFAEVAEVAEVQDQNFTNIDANKYMLKIAKDHFVSGKIAVLDQEGLVDMEVDDLAASTELISAVYMTVMGVTLDPKATPKDQPTKIEPTTDSNNTKTS